MPGLTVTEKQHWKERIARRIDKRIAAIEAEDPNLMERITREARQQALESLGLAGPFARLDEIERQRDALHEEEERVHRDVLAHIRGVPVEEIDACRIHHSMPEVEKAVHRRQDVYEDQLLAGSDCGRRLLALRAEREELLDTVWLAVSPVQIKELWGRVGKLLGESSTPLQQAALEIPPLNAVPE